jgi:hypothetical protein
MKKENSKRMSFRLHGPHPWLSLSGSIFITALSVLVVFCLPSCASKMVFSNSPVVPAAEGTVKIKRDNNHNYKIELKLMRLAEPSRLSPPRNAYVVWLVTEHDGTKNIGQLKTSSKLFSKTLRSSLNTVTPFKPRDFFITAEDDASVQYPGTQTVLKTGPF